MMNKTRAIRFRFTERIDDSEHYENDIDFRWPNAQLEACKTLLRLND